MNTATKLKNLEQSNLGTSTTKKRAAAFGNKVCIVDAEGKQHLISSNSTTIMFREGENELVDRIISLVRQGKMPEEAFPLTISIGAISLASGEEPMTAEEAKNVKLF